MSDDGVNFVGESRRSTGNVSPAPAPKTQEFIDKIAPNLKHSDKQYPKFVTKGRKYAPINPIDSA